MGCFKKPVGIPRITLTITSTIITVTTIIISITIMTVRNPRVTIGLGDLLIQSYKKCFVRGYNG